MIEQKFARALKETLERNFNAKVSISYIDDTLIIDIQPTSISQKPYHNTISNFSDKVVGGMTVKALAMQIFDSYLIYGLKTFLR